MPSCSPICCQYQNVPRCYKLRKRTIPEVISRCSCYRIDLNRQHGYSHSTWNNSCNYMTRKHNRKSYSSSYRKASARYFVPRICNTGNHPNLSRRIVYPGQHNIPCPYDWIPRTCWNSPRIPSSPKYYAGRLSRNIYWYPLVNVPCKNCYACNLFLALPHKAACFQLHPLSARVLHGPICASRPHTKFLPLDNFPLPC